MRLCPFLLVAAIARFAYVDVSSNRSRSTFVTSIASDQHDIPTQTFLRDCTEANEEERTNDTNLPGINKAISISRWRSENTAVAFVGKGYSVDDTIFLNPV